MISITNQCDRCDLSGQKREKEKRRVKRNKSSPTVCAAGEFQIYFMPFTIDVSQERCADTKIPSCGCVRGQKPIMSGPYAIVRHVSCLGYQLATVRFWVACHAFEPPTRLISVSGKWLRPVLNGFKQLCLLRTLFCLFGSPSSNHR